MSGYTPTHEALLESIHYRDGIIKERDDEIGRLRTDNEWLRGVMANSIAAQDWGIARRALEQKEARQEFVKDKSGNENHLRTVEQSAR